jgi:hypothetical protein
MYIHVLCVCQTSKAWFALIMCKNIVCLTQAY